MLPAEVSGYVPCHDVGFEVDDRAAFVATGDGHLEGVRYQSHLERARWLVQLRHGEADAVHSDGALDGDEPREGAGQLDGDLAPGRRGADRLDGGCGVDVTLDEVPIDQGGGAQRQLEIHLDPGSQRAQVGTAKRLGHDVGEEDRPGLFHDGEAASVDRDAAADLQPARDPGVIDADPAAIGLDHLGDGANYPGEHPRIP